MADPPTSTATMDARPAPPPREPDAHGQAALLLAESTLHALLEAKLLSRADVVEAVRTAAAVKIELADAEGESAATMQRSLFLLERIEQSFETVDDGPA